MIIMNDYLLCCSNKDSKRCFTFIKDSNIQSMKTGRSIIGSCRSINIENGENMFSRNTNINNEKLNSNMLVKFLTYQLIKYNFI